MRILLFFDGTLQLDSLPNVKDPVDIVVAKLTLVNRKHGNPHLQFEVLAPKFERQRLQACTPALSSLSVDVVVVDCHVFQS